MGDQITDYKCPQCGGPLHFAPETQQLECDYCGSTFKIQDVIDPEHNEQVEDVQPTEHAEHWSSQEKENFSTYNCQSCGAQLLADPHDAVRQCPYCGNNIILESKFNGEHKPNRVLPFILDETQAKQALMDFYRKKPFLPKAFKNKNRLQEVKGVYVPFFLYDGTVHGNLMAKASNSRSYREGDYIVTKTDHYTLYREGNILFENVPCDGSSNMPDEYMDSVEPFDYSKLVDFNTQYMAGYIADQYDVSKEENKDRAYSRMKNSTRKALLATCIGFQQVIPLYEQCNVTEGDIEYVYLPVYMLTTKWQNKTFLFAINGTNGKVAGELPSDKKTVALYALGMFIGFFLLISLIRGDLQIVLGGMI